MSEYEFQCTVWVRGDSAEAALKELNDEVDYHFGLDNNLSALESDEGTQEEGALYRFECTLWVYGSCAATAGEELLREVDYHFGQDNNLMFLKINKVIEENFDV